MSDRIKIFCGKCREKLDVTDLQPFSLFSCPNCESAIRVPRKFGPYLLEKICGSGGMSKVYRAADTVKKRRVAVKIISKEFSKPDTPDKLNREFDLIEFLNNPGVVNIFETGEIDGQYFLTMEYMNRFSLEYNFKQKTLPETKILLKMLSDIARTTGEIHQKGVIHHDIKPGNFLIDSGNAAKLADFGLAEFTVEAAEHPERFGMENPTGWASREYASPERLLTGSEDFLGDVYSFGISCYELLTGNLPFPSDGDEQDLYNIRQKMNYVKPGKLIAKFDKELAGAIDQMLAFDISERPDILEVADLLAEKSEQYGKKSGFWSKFF